MTTYQTPIVAGVFKSEMEARKAVDMLRNASFEREQLGVAMRNGGASTESLSNDFINLGVPRDRANFYEDEFKAGNIIISVRPDGREEEARTILSSNGAYDYNSAASAAQAVTEAQSTDQSALGVQQLTEEDKPEQEVLSAEDESSEEASEFVLIDEVQAETAVIEPLTREPADENTPDPSEIDASQTHAAEPDAEAAPDAGHDPDHAEPESHS